MNKMLLLYSTTDGHTLKISRRLIDEISKNGIEVILDDIANADSHELKNYSKVIVGASIRYGRHSQDVYDFINRYRTALDNMPNAFFSVNVVARKANKNRPHTNPYLKKFLRQVKWQPRQCAVFAGRINYAMYSFWDRNIIRLIMWITHGPTDPESDIEFTNWLEVSEYGRQLCR